METDLRVRVVEAAHEWLGTPYHHQASVKGRGCDCLGLLRGVYRDAVGEEPETPPPYSPSWGESGKREPMLEAAARHLDPIPLTDAGPGDVLVFRMKQGAVAKHCAVMVEEGMMIHAHSGRSVVKVTCGEAWQRKVAGAFRFRPS